MQLILSYKAHHDTFVSLVEVNMLFTVIPHKPPSYSLQLQTPHYTLHLVMKFPISLKEIIPLCCKELNLFIVNLQYVFSQHNKH